MRFLLCILAVILTYQSVNAQSLWRNSATTNRVPWLVSGYTNIVGTLTNPITTAGAISSTGGFTSAGSNYFGTVGSGGIEIVNGTIAILDTLNIARGIALTRNNVDIGGFNTGNALPSFYGAPGKGLDFIVNGSTPAIRVDHLGSVGVGNVYPQAKLDVTGDIRASTTITATNGFFLPTQTAPPVVAGGGTLWNSNSVLYWVTATKTNMVSDGR